MATGGRSAGSEKSVNGNGKHPNGKGLLFAGVAIFTGLVLAHTTFVSPALLREAKAEAEVMMERRLEIWERAVMARQGEIVGRIDRFGQRLDDRLKTIEAKIKE